MTPCAGYAAFPYSRFHNADGSEKIELLNAASGYFSDKVLGVHYGELQPLTVRQLWSYACPGGYTTPNSREAFCNSLKDITGNPPLQVPYACGGAGPDILPAYNPVVHAIAAVQSTGNSLLDQYTAQTNDRVKSISNAGIVIALFILLIGALFIFL